MTQISEEIKRKINESMMMTGGNTPEEKALWKEGAEYGYGLAQEEIDRLRNSGVKHILEQANEIEVLKDTIESQAKEIERLTDRIKSMEPELSMLRSYQGMTVTEQNEMIEQISQLKEALREFVDTSEREHLRTYEAAVEHNNSDGVGINYDYAPYPTRSIWHERFLNLLNDKK